MYVISTNMSGVDLMDIEIIPLRTLSFFPVKIVKIHAHVKF